MNSDQREIQRKLRVLEHADRIGDVSCSGSSSGMVSGELLEVAKQVHGHVSRPDAHALPLKADYLGTA
jgi:hypothetical protein